nr:MAG TPA: hypothetical protein [Caudoviricetes sp.]DAJ41429.1 MAG TPA: hypothetical protein [Caudoviricetes sp.]
MIIVFLMFLIYHTYYHLLLITATESTSFTLHTSTYSF